eukprot:PhM_4_TR3699/c0_g1_i1/m.80308
MSKVTLPFIQGSALSSNVAAAVSQVLAKTAPQVQLTAVKATRADVCAAFSGSRVAVGSALTSEEIAGLGAFNTVVTTSKAPVSLAVADYAGVDVSVVRAIATDAEPVAIRFRDRVDVFPAQGVSVDAENAALLAGFRASAQRAAEAARARGTGVTLVLKQVSRHQNLNELLHQAAKEVVEGAGLTLEVVGASQAFNMLVMFPEQLGVVLTNDIQSSDNFEGFVTGIAGGAGVSYKTLVGTEAKAFVGATSDVNPAGTLYAAAAALADLGLAEESKRTASVLTKALENAANRTSDIGGKLDTAAFAKVLCA